MRLIVLKTNDSEPVLLRLKPAFSIWKPVITLGV
jgi:hypothetical protein